MRTLFKALVAIVLVVPVAAHPMDRADARALSAHHKPNIAEATGLVPTPGSVRSSARIKVDDVSRNVDGLSRNDDDCNVGCIDHRSSQPLASGPHPIATTNADGMTVGNEPASAEAYSHDRQRAAQGEPRMKTSITVSLVVVAAPAGPVVANERRGGPKPLRRLKMTRRMRRPAVRQSRSWELRCPSDRMAPRSLAWAAMSTTKCESWNDSPLLALVAKDYEPAMLPML
jgi:hypothetical protein